MWVFDRYSPYSYQNNRDKYKDDDEKREFTLKECLWFCMTSLTPQGGGKWGYDRKELRRRVSSTEFFNSFLSLL